MSKVQERRLKLLQQFQFNKVLSLDDIMNTYGVSKRTVQGDIESLNSMGYSISMPRSGENKGCYIFEQTETLATYDEQATGDIYYVSEAMNGIAGDMLILLLLQDENGRKLELASDELYRKVRGKELSEDGTYLYGSKSSWYKSAIKRLKEAHCIKERIVIDSGKSVIKYQLDIAAPRFVKLAQAGDIGYDDFYTVSKDILEEYNGDRDTRIKRILSKLQLHMTGVKNAQEIYYIVGERLIDEEKAIEQIKTQLIKYPYREKALRVKYKTLKGNQVFTEDIKVGMLLFAVSTNSLYLVAERVNGTGMVYIMVSTIEQINTLEDVDNDIYNSEKYVSAVKYMLGPAGISMNGTPVDIRVEFDRFSNVEDKVKTYVEARKKQGASASLSYSDDGKTLIYKDCVYGVADIKSFLRGFGSSCRVIEPEELKKDMVNSAWNILDKYKSEGYDIRDEKR
ncbi:MAG: WYL domain-containing protein [Lachnospiraceae bacterium]|nr:WYL domain-containing protein [Lachnospiraceae bacterium]